MKKIIIFALFLLVIAAVIGLYIFEIVVNDAPPAKNLAKALLIIIPCLLGMARLMANPTRKSLSFYEEGYREELDTAFSRSPMDRKKLLCAVRLFDEGNYNKSLKYLADLKSRASTRADVGAVGLFIALCFTRVELYDAAIKTYTELVGMGVTSSRIYSNLANCCSEAGRHDEAVSYIHLAIQNDPDNAYAYHNLASIYFETSDFDKAIEYAEKALSINLKLRESATLLAILYSMKGDKPNAEKYSHLALSAGEPAERLKRAIEHYMASVNGENREDEAHD